MVFLIPNIIMIYVICKNNPIIGNNHICDIKRLFLTPRLF
nr:MAG TPA: hypothetical protein [Caudoviricetes sp.]